jgi:hypothetical protein
MTAIHYPPIFINEYLADKISTNFNRFSDNSIAGSNRFNLRFFPTSPTDIEALTQGFPPAEDDLFAVYDRMFKMRRTAFPHIKCEQLLYYFYKMSGDPVALIKASQAVLDLLDRGDESAQELNAWIRNLHLSQGKPTTTIENIVTGSSEKFKSVTIKGEQFLLPFFHEIKIYQLEETRDIIDFGTARTYAGNKIIIDYDWHSSDPIK